MTGLKLIAAAKALPQKVIDNNGMKAYVETDDEWIRSRTGIVQRRFLSGDETLTGLAVEASRKALARAGIDPSEIGCVIFASISPDHATPGTACLIQAALGLPGDIPVLDISAACSGFLFGVETARGFLSYSDRRYALVVGGDAMSRLLDMTDRSTCVLFGDGAAAAIFRAEENALYASHQGVNGNRVIEASRIPGATPYLKMDGAATYRFAVSTMPRCADAVLKKAGLTLDEIDWVVCHQANARIIDACAKAMHAPQEKFYKNLMYYGNTSAASIPLALSDMQDEDLLRPGMRILSVGFGAGLQWAGICFTVG